MSERAKHNAELAKLKRSVAAYKAGKRVRPPKMLACCVCVKTEPNTPTVETRFGPRCSKHLPEDPPTEGTE